MVVASKIAPPATERLAPGVEEAMPNLPVASNLPTSVPLVAKPRILGDILKIPVSLSAEKE